MGNRTSVEIFPPSDFLTKLMVIDSGKKTHSSQDDDSVATMISSSDIDYSMLIEEEKRSGKINLFVRSP